MPLVISSNDKCCAVKTFVATYIFEILKSVDALRTKKCPLQNNEFVPFKIQNGRRDVVKYRNTSNVKNYMASCGITTIHFAKWYGLILYRSI